MNIGFGRVTSSLKSRNEKSGCFLMNEALSGDLQTSKQENKTLQFHAYR